MLVKTLGICWKIKDDTFAIETNVKENPFTRRGILSTIGSVYDPLGIVAPFVTKGKIILQSLCRSKLNWGQPIDKEHRNDWQKWLQSLKKIGTITIPRTLKPVKKKEELLFEIHHFADASKKACSVVSYLRTVDVKKNVHMNFIFGKARVSPIKTLTVPRLELTAATLMVRINDMIIQALQEIEMHKTYFWTDSQSVLKYINNEDTRFHIFVANRVALISERTNLNQWHYVPTAVNPTDDGSRATQSSRWLKRPNFLLKSEEHWSSQNMKYYLDEDVKEVKCRTITLKDAEGSHPIDILCTYFSDWYRLKRAVVWLCKVRDKLRKHTDSSNILLSNLGDA